MLTWLKQLFAGRSLKARAADIFATAEGSDFERCAIAGLMTAIEAEEVAKHRATVKTEQQTNFLMAYECLMMWAIKSGMDTTLSAKDTESAVVAMLRHIAKNGYYQAGAFEQIWAAVQKHMRFAMAISQQPGAPPPYPFADMLMAAKIAGYEIDAETQEFIDLTFGIYLAKMMAKLTEAAQLAAKDLQKPPK
jgi:hypothetical protein